MIDTAPLSHISAGHIVRVKDLHAPTPLRTRLAAMGIFPGTEIEICQKHSGKGCVCIRVRNASLVLDDAMARVIECENISPMLATERQRCCKTKTIRTIPPPCCSS